MNTPKKPAGASVLELMNGTAPQLRPLVDALNEDKTTPPVEAAGRYPLLTLDELLATEDAETPWLVPRFLPEGEVIVVLAHPKAGKTGVAVELGLATATGTPAFGHDGYKPTQQGPVVLWLSEDNTAGIKSRLRAMAAGHGRVIESNNIPLYVHTRDTFRAVPGVGRVQLNVTDAEARNAFISECRKIQPVLVVLDTMMSIAESEDENSSGVMHNIMKCIRNIRDELGCTVLVTHHVGKDSDTNNGRDVFQRARGSSAIRGAWDGAFAITPIKAKKEGERDTFRVQFEMRGIDGGKDVTLSVADKLLDKNGRALKWQWAVVGEQTDQEKQEKETAEEQDRWNQDAQHLVTILRKLFNKDPVAWHSQGKVVELTRKKATRMRAVLEDMANRGLVAFRKNGQAKEYQFKAPSTPQQD